ncbi:MAG: TetR/AcrR family transcriptional regulator [Actinomycetota bacterium]
MTTRVDAVSQTRQRIVEATVRLHGQNGIFGTSWKDIAREAEVAVGTVYKHFPSLDELVPACGELLMQRIEPPSPEDAANIIGDATDVRERLLRVTTALFAFYDRGGNHLENDLRERALPAVREWEQYQRDTIIHFLRTALGADTKLDDRLRLAAAVLDFRSYSAMRAHGLEPATAAEQVTAMIASCLERVEAGNPVVAKATADI